MISKLISTFITAICFASAAQAKINIVTTTSDLQALAVAIGGDRVNVDTLIKGIQDPHHLEAKPSFVLKVSHADLLISNGLGLEAAWLPKVLAGARNKAILTGQPGNFVASEGIAAMEVPVGQISRADGDVHQEGNPHITLDPDRIIAIGKNLATRLAQLDSAGSGYFQQRADAFEKELVEKLPAWTDRLKKSGITKVLTYHKTLNYFLHRFDIVPAGYLEPHPGVAPTARHILETITTAKNAQIKLILVENFFDETAAKRIASEVGGMTIKSVPVSVGGRPEIHNFVDLFEHLVQSVEGKSFE